MTTSLEELLKKEGEHGVGYFSSIVEPRQLDGGAKCDVDIDNFELVKIVVDNTDPDDVFHIKPIEAATERGHIVYSAEVLHLGEYEDKRDFYNGKGTMARVFFQEPFVTFKVSNFKVADSGKDADDVKKGWYASYVPATSSAKGYYSLSATAPTGSANVYRVVGMTTDTSYELLELPMVELLIDNYITDVKTTQPGS